MFSSDYGYTEHAADRGAKHHKDYKHANPFATRGRRSPTSGQQQYDSDGAHGQSESASLRDAELAGSIAAATEITRDLLAKQNISAAQAHSLETEPAPKELDPIAPKVNQ